MNPLHTHMTKLLIGGHLPTDVSTSLAVRAKALATGADVGGVDEAAHVLEALLGAASEVLLGLVGLGHLGGLVAHLTGTGKRSVHLATTEAEHQVEGRLLLDVVVREGAAILELLAGEDETLLVGGDALLVLDLGLDSLDRVRGLHLEGDRLASQGLDEDLHSSSEAKHQVESRLLLDVVVREGAAILELLAGEDETLLVGGDALLVLDLGLDSLNGVRGLNLEGDSLSGKGLDEDLHVC
mmetsp:Transcript_6014/g.13348  ORF Transcript_6014/g.13348 Transcript_6014/m.13348 type:complete len:240 (+) Transcript_6014:69-788(+)